MIKSALTLALAVLCLASTRIAAADMSSTLLDAPAMKAADARLNQAWKALLDGKSPREVTLLRSMQRDWLKSYPPHIRDANELARYYDERTAYLKSITGRNDLKALIQEEAVFGRYGRQVEACWYQGEETICNGMVDSAVFLLPTAVPGEARLIINTLFFNLHTCTLNEVGKFNIATGVLKVKLETGDEPYIQDVIAGENTLRIERPTAGTGFPAYCGVRGSIFNTYPRWRVVTGR